jgi:hypothetical protein
LIVEFFLLPACILPCLWLSVIGHVIERNTTRPTCRTACW